MVSEPDIVTFWFNVLKPVALDAVIAYDADAAKLELTAFKTYDAVCAVVINEAVMAFCAHDAVPNNDPVIPAVTLSEPVMLELPCEKYPFFIMNSFAIYFSLSKLWVYYLYINMIRFRNVLWLH
jgi:hypothetical protein